MPLLRLFIDICLLRAGPQDLPAAPFLVGLTLAGYAFSGLAVLLPAEGGARAVGMVALDSLLLLAFVAALLRWRGHPARFRQTASALLGSGALLGLLLLPIIALSQAGEGLAQLASPLWLVLFAWSLTVTGHVLRHALQLPFPAGVLLALVYFVLSLSLVQALFPGAVEG